MSNNEFNPSRLRLYVLIGAVLFFGLFFMSKTFVIIQPTERAVIFKKYTTGLDKDNIKGAGLSIVAPWNDVIRFEVSEQQIEENMDVLSQDGLSISLDVSIRFRPNPNKIGYLYESFRDQYQTSLVRPELRSAVRRIIGQYTPEELYATKRQEIETQIEEVTRKVLDANYIELKALLFRSIQLPKSIQNSIEEKMAADQEAQKYNFLIEKEKKEAERRRIDAEGKARANEILNASLTDNILKEKGVLATERLAASPNAKIIVIGGGDGGLPIILGNQ